jgi:hypothetical protein
MDFAIQMLPVVITGPPTTTTKPNITYPRGGMSLIVGPEACLGFAPARRVEAGGLSPATSSNYTFSNVTTSRWNPWGSRKNVA